MLHEYRDLLQAQPKTSRSKPRVWFATNDNNDQVVIKGPLPANVLDQYMRTEELKIALDLPRTNARIDRGYIIQDSLFDYMTYPTRIVSTKLERDVKVPIASVMGMWEHRMTEHLGMEILIGLLFRKIVGCSDTCIRNFIVKDARVYSIDDPNAKIDSPYLWSRNYARLGAAIYQPLLEANWDAILLLINRWKDILADDEYAMRQLNFHSEIGNWKW